MTLGEKLRKLRVQHKMSMSEVARLSELSADHRGRITQGYLSRLESGKETNPSLQKILTICNIYDIDPNELMQENSKSREPKYPFSTKTARNATQNTETGIRRIAESLAKSSKHVAAVKNLLESGTGKQFLNTLASMPAKHGEEALKKALTLLTSKQD